MSVEIPESDDYIIVKLVEVESDKNLVIFKVFVKLKFYSGSKLNNFSAIVP